MLGKKRPAASFRSGCEGGSTCVEVAHLGGLVVVRDSKDSASPVLGFYRHEWIAFVAAVKRGEFDFA